MPRFSAFVLAAVLWAGAGAQGDARQAAAATARSPENASYTLRASLDPSTQTLRGSGRLTWRNITKAPAGEIRLHLYWNAWRNSASSWMRERVLAGGAAMADRPAEDWGWIDLTKISIANGADLLARGRFTAPDDGNTSDRTVWAAPLDHPVAPGETIDIDLAWVSHVPRTFARTGVIGDYYFIGQWFPKIGVFQDDGTWNCHQFHSATEFFSDFGRYDVTLDVPDGWRVGATGREASVRHFVQDDVHDFAWTTSPDFVQVDRRFEAPGLPPVDVRLLLQPEHADQADRHFDAAATALRDYGTWFGPYPYDHLTVVDPVAIVDPVQGASTGGMEYPTLVTAGTRFIAPWRGPSPEGVTIHEVGHQFWYGVVATNEFEDAWMDEGLNTYSTARAIAETFPGRFVAVDRYFGGLAAWAYADVPWSREIDGDRLNPYRLFASADVPSKPTWQYWPATASVITYDKTALWLHTLERYLGWPTMQRILSTYFARGAFRHPTPAEFFAIANEVSGRDLTWFFDAVYRSSAVFDYAVGQVTSLPSGPRGMIGDASTTFVPGSTAAGFDDVVVVNRLGDGVFPIDVRVTFDDGGSVVERWDGRDRWHAFRYRRATPVRTVEVDPDRVLLLDVNYTNNTWTAKPQAARAADKWSLRWLTWLEELLVTYGSLS